MIWKVVALAVVCSGMAMGQAIEPSPTTSAAKASVAAAVAPARAYAFDVVSIRQNISVRTAEEQQQFAPTPDGYRMINLPMGLVIITAYVPQMGGAGFYSADQLKGFSDWLNTERYDIDARISNVDRAEWQNPESQRVMSQAMLQALLAERCKLVVHRETKEVAVYSLVVAKGGVKFKETDPTVEHPDGQKLPWGGTLVPAKNGMSFYGASMASFASIVSAMGKTGRPVQDKTGLSGKYDLVMKFPDRGQGETGMSDPASMFDSVLGDLGLKLESSKGQVEMLVIDHIERPSVN